MPTFTIKVTVTNKGNASVSAHVGASLVGASDHVEYFNTSEDVKYTFKVGDTSVTRYLSTDLGAYQKYYLYVALWEGEKLIGTGKKYASAVLPNAVEKKKKIVVNMTLGVPSVSPTSFFGE